MLSPPTPPRADSTFEEGIVDDSGAQGVGPWCAHALFGVVSLRQFQQWDMSTLCASEERGVKRLVWVSSKHNPQLSYYLPLRYSQNINYLRILTCYLHSALTSTNPHAVTVSCGDLAIQLPLPPLLQSVMAPLHQIDHLQPSSTPLPLWI